MCRAPSHALSSFPRRRESSTPQRFGPIANAGVLLDPRLRGDDGGVAAMTAERMAA
jgi:hypothetical protein